MTWDAKAQEPLRRRRMVMMMKTHMTVTSQGNNFLLLRLHIQNLREEKTSKELKKENKKKRKKNKVQLKKKKKEQKMKSGKDTWRKSLWEKENKKRQESCMVNDLLAEPVACEPWKENSLFEIGQLPARLLAPRE